MNLKGLKDVVEFSRRKPWKDWKLNLYTWKKLKNNSAVWPLIGVQFGVLVGVTYIIYHRMFLTTIDVQLSQKINQRFEVSSKPGFIDLRNPRLLRLIGCNTPEPAIDLDNRYRLMRHEQMLDAQGNLTDKFIKDSRVNSFEEYIEIHNLNQ